MKSTLYFVTLTIFCNLHFRICAGVNDSEIQGNYIRDRSSSAKWTCSSNDDCTTLDTKCIDKTCQCPPKYVFNAQMTSCLKAAANFGDVCEDTTQCTVLLLAGGNCNDGICGCVKGYHYLHGRCIKSSSRGEKCISDDECYANAEYDALSCSNGICQCSSGFYEREYRTCRRKSQKIGAVCMIDLDCTFDKNARCNIKGVCAVASNVTNISRRGTYEVVGSSEVQKNQEDVIVGGKCAIDDDCKVLGAAVCDATYECACLPGHFANKQLKDCVPELGEKCIFNDPTWIKNSACWNGRWNCRGVTVASRNNRICRKVTTVYNKPCQFDEQCYIFGPDALCQQTPSKKCVCNDNSHYSDVNLFCWINRAVGESCKNDEDCYVNGSDSRLTCTDSICSCPVGKIVNANGTSCVCPENYFDVNGNCLRGIGANCTLDTECKAEHSTCASQRCSCPNGFVAPTITTCVAVSSFGDDCQYDDQCSAKTEGAICLFPKIEDSDKMRSKVTNGICCCDAGHHYKYNRCYQRKVLDEACKARGECYVESSLDSVVCRKGVCSCQWDAIRINDTYCQSGASSTTVLQNLLVLAIIIRYINF